jgi:hypothetical protein
MLTLRLDGIPNAMFPPSEEPLMIFFGADVFRIHKDNITKAGLCVIKAMIHRTAEKAISCRDGLLTVP